MYCNSCQGIIAKDDVVYCEQCHSPLHTQLTVIRGRIHTAFYVQIIYVLIVSLPACITAFVVHEAAGVAGFDVSAHGTVIFTVARFVT